MLKSFLLRRPHALFDPDNEQHRRAYYDYLKTNSWNGCPYHFVLEEPFLDLPSSINYKMVLYYTNKEFAQERRRKQRIKTT